MSACLPKLNVSISTGSKMETCHQKHAWRREQRRGYGSKAGHCKTVTPILKFITWILLFACFSERIEEWKQGRGENKEDVEMTPLKRGQNKEGERRGMRSGARD